jgi:RimJ/RimL family protein N-acetyltransferase
MISTNRLVLREWREEDREPFAALNADPVAMEFFPKTLTREESDASLERYQAHWDEHGWGIFAAEYEGRCIGFIGASTPGYRLPFSPCVEIGWRLSRDVWGRGLAPEGARAVLQYCFHTLRLPEVVSFTALINLKSQRVMEKIGMKRDVAADFDHPKVEAGHPLCRHLLYRIRLCPRICRGAAKRRFSAKNDVSPESESRFGLPRNPHF